MFIKIGAGLLLAASLAACSQAPASAPARHVDNPHAAADRIQHAVPEVRELREVTADNDPNKMIGRSTGYTAATVLVDPRVECPPGDLAVACGAGIEQWPDETAARQRDEYIKRMTTSMPFLGSEYSTVKGNLLLRVSGQLPPSAAEQYKAAFLAG
jgi:hypothetical protein